MGGTRITKINRIKNHIQEAYKLADDMVMGCERDADQYKALAVQGALCAARELLICMKREGE